MKRLGLLAVGLLSMLIMSGCGPTLKEYVAMSSTYYSNVTSRSQASVNIEGNARSAGLFGRIGGAAVSVVSGIAASTVSSQQTARLQSISDSREIAQLVTSGFDEGFGNATNMAYAESRMQPDMRINIMIQNYGLWADSLLSPLHFYVEAQIEMIYMPEMKSVYSNGMTLSREVSNVITELAHTTNSALGFSNYSAKGIITNNVTRMVAGAASLKEFFDMSDEEIVAILQLMAYDTGSALAGQLTRNIYR